MTRWTCLLTCLLLCWTVLRVLISRRLHIVMYQIVFRTLPAAGGMTTREELPTLVHLAELAGVLAYSIPRVVMEMRWLVCMISFCVEGTGWVGFSESAVCSVIFTTGEQWAVTGNVAPSVNGRDLTFRSLRCVTGGRGTFIGTQKAGLGPSERLEVLVQGRAQVLAGTSVTW